MKSTVSNKSLAGLPNPAPDFTYRQKLIYSFHTGSKNLVDFAKYSYLALVMILLLCAVVELKQIFHIDLFPGVDTPIDNAYFAGKENLGGNIL